MTKHDFYADPTVFDYWQNNARDWICERLGRVCPYAWSFAFLLIGLACALIGITVFFNMLMQAVSGLEAVAWNQLAAQTLTLLVALTATPAPFKVAMKAWPKRQLPKSLAAAVARWGLDSGSPMGERPQDSTPVEVNPAGREAVQEFFAEVRAAGVNVAIAKTLFGAGIRSAHQLRNIPDSDLLNIRGVGPATLHRLRTRFKAC
ncbi:MAG: helix-hairpin-helix domain-containing protein [Thiogranum sp.]|nr:helix-hairpin-helix domain-containing protein [Thiogranum sp.]